MKKKPAARLSEAFIRSPDCSAYLVDLKLPPELWAVFALAEQPVTAEQIVARTGLALETARLALRRLVRRKLLQKHVVGWQDYLNATPAAIVEPAAAATPAAATPVVTAKPDSPAVAPTAFVRPASTPAATRGTPAEVTFSLRNADADARRRSVASGEVVVRLTRGDTAPATTTAGRKLRPILDAIIEKGGGGLQGQLLAYRVFLRVPVELAAAAGLSSLSLVDDDFTVHDPRLIEALFEAARTVAGLESLPQAA